MTFEPQAGAAERLVERVILSSRWLRAPLYVGLILVLGLVVVKFFQYFFQLGTTVFSADESRMVLYVLSLVDLVIVAISSIHLFTAFLDAASIPNDKLVLLVVIHLTFAVSAILLAHLDRIAFGASGHESAKAGKDA